MTYYLHAQILAVNKRLPITCEEFNELSSAQKTLSAALHLEKAFDLLISNYDELELSVFEMSLKEKIYSEPDSQASMQPQVLPTEGFKIYLAPRNYILTISRKILKA